MKKLFLLSLAISYLNAYSQTFETFNFTGSLNANGWTTHSGVTPGQQQTLTSASDQGNSLYFSTLAYSAGNRTTLVAGNSEDVNKAITGISGTGYFSFLLKVTNTTGLTTIGDYFTGFGASAGTTLTVLAARTFIKAGVTPNTFQLGIQNTTGGTPTQTYLPTEYPIGTTVLVVVKLNTSVSPIVADLFVNPVPGSPEPLPSVSNSSGSAAINSLASIFLRQAGTASIGTGNLEIDEIRVGSNWASVTPEYTCNTMFSFSASECGSYTVPSGDETYTSSGIFMDTIPNAALCDSILTIDLTIIPPETYYIDNDNDTYGDAAFIITDCVQPVGYVTNANDCDDSNNAIFPGAVEICDGLDNDCINGIDDGLTFVNYYTDADNDNYGTGTPQSLCSNPGAGYSTQNGDCNDANPAMYPGATEIFDNGVDENCDGTDNYVGINEITLLHVSVQPNPSNGSFTINLNQDIDAMIQVIDLNGKIHFTARMQSSELQLDLSELAKGTYLLTVNSVTTVIQKRIVIQ